MISFRYHVFTVVAVFLAVALGIAVGNAYVQPALVGRLERQTHDFQEELADVRARLVDIEQATDVLPILVNGNLAGRRVVVVTHVGVDDRIMSQVRSSLEAADAELVAALAVTEKMSASGQPERDELAELLGVEASDDPAPLRQGAAEVVADRLAEGSPDRDADSEADVLNGLLEKGFLSFPEGSSVTEGDLEGVGGNGEIVIVAAGGEDEPTPATDEFLVPFIAELLARGVRVAAGESAGTNYPFVSVLRDDAATDGRIVTVDDVDLSIGGAALVLGLERLIELGQGGDYGFKGSDVTPIPPP